jgi:hypothetical protein
MRLLGAISAQQLRLLGLTGPVVRKREAQFSTPMSTTPARRYRGLPSSSKVSGIAGLLEPGVEVEGLVQPDVLGPGLSDAGAAR